MSFTSAVFLIIFFPICILGCYFMQEKYRNLFLCLASAVFYSWCGFKFLILMLISATIAYVIGRAIEDRKTIQQKRILLAVALLYNLGVLFFYKYLFEIFPDTLNLVTDLLGKEAGTFKTPVLPLGISFYTFSVLSYILDVYWGKCKAQKNIINLYFYVIFFPKVVQGPIMRYSDFEKQLYNRMVNLDMLNLGLERFIKGMVKKVMIADQIQPLVTYSFSNIKGVGTVPAWIGLISYLLQLYYDFSGYSDMAIGLGKMVGFQLPENFDHPYLSQTVAEYWRRWHISLGEWFRDYVYMPCSRSVMAQPWIDHFKKKKMLVCDLAALLVTWIATGVWHGSGLKFLIYGLWWFSFIAFERLRTEHRKKVRKQKKLPLKKDTRIQIISDHIVTVIAFIFGQVMFRADSLQTTVQYWKKMLVWDTTDGIIILHQFDNYMVFALVVGLVFVFPVYGIIKKNIFERNMLTQFIFKNILVTAAFVAFCYAISAGYSAFLYEVF